MKTTYKQIIKNLLRTILKNVNLGSIDPIYKELNQNKDISKVSHIVKQLRSDKPYVDFQYKNDTIRIINEPSSIYHIINSTSKMEKLVNSSRKISEGVMLDIGANIGLFSFFYNKKNPNVHIYLFEPDEKLIPIIEKNLGSFDNYTIINAAVGHKKGSQEFFINAQSSQTNSLIEESVLPFAKKNDITSKIVDVVRIEDICQKYNISKINTLKIDIQGGEYEVFNSDENLFDKIDEALVEVSFMSDDTLLLTQLLSKHYSKYNVINQVYMGADLLFYNP